MELGERRLSAPGGLAANASGFPASARSLEGQLEGLHAASLGWALACCGWARDEAEEVLQVAYLKVWDGRAQFAGRSTLKTWFFAVIRRTAAERRRNRALRQLLFADWQGREPSLPPVPDPETDCRHSQASKRLLAALAHLPRRQREVLHLVFYQDLTVDEAAGVLGIGVGSARVHYSRGKAGLRQRLGQKEALL